MKRAKCAQTSPLFNFLVSDLLPSNQQLVPHLLPQSDLLQLSECASELSEYRKHLVHMSICHRTTLHETLPPFALRLLTDQHNVEHLSAYCSARTFNEIVAKGVLKNVKSLVLYVWTLTVRVNCRAVTEALKQGQLRNLTRVDINSSTDTGTVSLVETLKECVSLKYLKWSNIKCYDNEDYREIGACLSDGAWPLLEALHVETGCFASEFTPLLRGIGANQRPTLKELSLYSLDYKARIDGRDVCK